MILQSISIFNYRSVQQEKLVIEKVDGSSTYCFLGINESGKSSLLKGINLMDSEISYPLDYFDDSQPVSLHITYAVSSAEVDDLRNHFQKELGLSKKATSQINFDQVSFVCSFEPEAEPEAVYSENLNFTEKHLKGYMLKEGKIVEKDKNEEDSEDLNLEEFYQKHLTDHFSGGLHNIVFWESSERYLVTDEIDLQQFASKPLQTSVPLTNCFKLAGIKQQEIGKAISKLTFSAPIFNLESRLSSVVTTHIKNVWPEHPVTVKFKINNNKISLLIEDDGVQHKAKTTNQRSDGFKQFISFLLTVSAENSSKELSKTIMLIDEPETHLHPQAQINLREELINITVNSNDNVVFYATHSNYMIDKRNLQRNFRVIKDRNETTKVIPISSLNSSYSEVNYTIFNIPTTDYHNELYGFLHDTNRNALEKLSKDKQWINELSGKTETISLSKYIRNSIHHPENKSNRPFTEAQLLKSIKLLRDIKYGDN